MPQSQYLTDFYREYLAWVDAGAGDHPAFNRSAGLCLNLVHHARWLNIDHEGRFLDEMEAQFEQGGLNKVYPFNLGEYSVARQSYLDECRLKSCYTNEARLKWVRQHVQQEG